MKHYDELSMEVIREGKDLIFQFKSDAIDFCKRNNLKIDYKGSDQQNEEHFIVKGHKSSIYWIID